MERFMLFVRGAAAVLIAVAVGSGAGFLLGTLLPDSNPRFAGVASLAVMAVTCWVLYPKVTGNPRNRRALKRSAQNDNE
jgi:hypothetical protein